MRKYEQLVNALRHCMTKEDGITICEPCPYYGKGIDCEDVLHTDAAAAIEALQAELPKRGKWITHPEVKNIYGGVYIECPFCGEKYVVQDVSDEKFCRNCGSDLRAKMEVRDADT